MEILQDELPFRPITIKLESLSEAKALFGIIDKVDALQLNLDALESAIVRKLSDAQTNQEVIILK